VSWQIVPHDLPKYIGGPNREGAARAMKLALDHARISPEQVDYINAHATSTDIGDLCETRAIKQIFGEYANKVSISATKSMTGHLLGGAGGIEMAACALAIRDSVIPPTINLENPDVITQLDLVPLKAQKRPGACRFEPDFGRAKKNSLGRQGMGPGVRRQSAPHIEWLRSESHKLGRWRARADWKFGTSTGFARDPRHRNSLRN